MTALQTAIQLRDHGHQLVLDAEPAMWTAAAQRAIARLAASGQAFTADDVCELVGRPLHCNAVGALFRRAVASGVLQRAEGMVQSQRVEARGRWLPAYRGIRS